MGNADSRRVVNSLKLGLKFCVRAFFFIHTRDSPVSHSASPLTLFLLLAFEVLKLSFHLMLIQFVLLH